MCWDLRNFFDSCARSQIEREGVSIAALKSALIDGAPRQGLPTSPALANLAAAQLDRDVLEYLDGMATYTRYADDLTVSCDNAELLPELLRDIPRLVERAGFVVHPGKTSVQHSAAGRRVICGVAVDADGSVHATRTLRRRARAAAHHVAHGDVRCADQARGLSEWCAQRLPVVALLQQRLGGHVPSSSLLEALNTQSRKLRLRLRAVVEVFDARSYLRASRKLDELAPQHAERSRWAVGLACVFGTAWAAWVDGCAERGCSAHDACDWLPTDVRSADGLGSRLMRWRREIPDLLSRGSDLAIVARWWSSLTSAQRTLPFVEIVKYAKSRAYVGARSAEFAAECASHAVSEDAYLAMEGRWSRGIASLSRESIPRVRVEHAGYVARVLDREDPRGLWAGEHTACCQHPGAEGESCAWNGALSPDGAILAIERDGKIVAQSWLWRSGDVVVADNIEALKGHSDALPAVYEAFARALVGQLCIAEMRVGARNCDCSTDQWLRVDAIESPRGCYSDAGTQRRIKHDPEARIMLWTIICRFCTSLRAMSGRRER